MDRAAWMGLLKDWGLAGLITLVAVAVWRLVAPAPVDEGAAPPLVLADVAGGEFRLETADAPVYVINFWATWCAPCRQEIPEFSAFAQAHPEIAVLGVSVDDAMPASRLRREAEKLGITYRVLHDPSQIAADRWGVTVYPTTFVLNEHHEVVATQVGVMNRARLEKLVAQATAE